MAVGPVAVGGQGSQPRGLPLGESEGVRAPCPRCRAGGTGGARPRAQRQCGRRREGDALLMQNRLPSPTTDPTENRLVSRRVP